MNILDENFDDGSFQILISLLGNEFSIYFVTPASSFGSNNWYIGKKYMKIFNNFNGILRNW